MQRIDGERILGRWPRTALTLLTVTVVAYCLASGAAVLLLQPDLPALDDGSSRALKGSSKVSVPPLNFFAPIWDRNAFKAARPQPKPKPKPKPPTIDQLQVAKVKSQLLGTMYSEVGALSRAVVLQGNTQSLVKTGDKLEGFVIEEIKRRAIVLAKGNLRQLLLIDNADKKIAADKGEERKMLSRRELKGKFQDLDALSRDIQLSPATRGKEQGLWVRYLRNDSLFSKAGLQEDDVILRVGGQSVTSGVNPVSLFKLLDRDQVAVDVLRDGKPMQLILILTG